MKDKIVNTRFFCRARCGGSPYLSMALMKMKSDVAMPPISNNQRWRSFASFVYSAPKAYPTAITPIHGIRGYRTKTSGLGKCGPIGKMPGWWRSIHNFAPQLGTGLCGPCHGLTGKRSRILWSAIITRPKPAVIFNGKWISAARTIIENPITNITWRNRRNAGFRLKKAPSLTTVNSRTINQRPRVIRNRESSDLLLPRANCR